MDDEEASIPPGGGDDDSRPLGGDAAAPGLGEHAVLAGIADLRRTVLGLLDAGFWSMSDAQSRDAVRAGFAVSQQLYAVFLRLVGDLDARPEGCPGARAGSVAQTFMVHALNRSPGLAAADVRAAHALAPDADPGSGGLPRLGAALAAGEVSREHTRVAVSAIGRIPRKLLREDVTTEDVADLGLDEVGHMREMRCRGDMVDHLITDLSKRSSPATVDQLGQHLLHAADPDGSRSFDPDACTRRGLSLVKDSTGMDILRGELDAATGAAVRAALDAFGKPDPSRTETAEDGTTIEIKDTRTGRQRYADALGTIARLAMQWFETGSCRGADSPRIVVHAGVTDVAAADAARGQDTAENCPQDEQGAAAEHGDHGGGGDGGGDPERDRRSSRGSQPPHRKAGEFASGGLVDPALLALFRCDAILQSVVLDHSGAVLNLGRDVRTVSPAQRRALVARDGGCVIPGCTAPAHWCQGHHVQWFRHGGDTDIDNLALVCGRHHTAIHLGIWALTMRDGVPWPIPPTWVDREQRPIRNTYRDDVERFHRLGTQLRLDLDADLPDQLGQRQRTDPVEDSGPLEGSHRPEGSGHADRPAPPTWGDAPDPPGCAA